MTPLVLNGALTVDNAPSATVSTTNPDGSSSSSVYVSGSLGSLGQVEGFWTTSQDQFGDDSGLQTLRLHNAKGTIIIAIDTQNPSPSRPAGHGTVYQEYSQNLFSGTGAYTGTAERGSIETISNRAQTVVTTLLVHTRAV
jgi:hypothetical protein